MATRVAEYRYSPAAISRARLLFGASLTLITVLIVVLLGGRQSIGPLGLALGIALLLVMLSTARAQLGRLGFVLRLAPERLEIVAPLSKRSIAWSEIAEVRRIAYPRVLGPPVWVCALVLRGRRGTQQVFVFDSSLERAEHAFREITSRSEASTNR